MSRGIAALMIVVLFQPCCSARSWHVSPDALVATQAQQPRLSDRSPQGVSANGRHLVDSAGRPFFWLGDTAWLLFQMTTREEADLYLRTRAQQGFTVVQAALVMGEERVGGTLRANVYGDQAFIGGNPARPLLTPGSAPAVAVEYDYWDHVDYIVGAAAAHGVALGVLPLFVGFDGAGYAYLTTGRAFGYGLMLGRRYGGHHHVFWILGGDNSPDTVSKRTVWNEVARGITVGAGGGEDYSRTLMTYHINGNNSSSQWFHEAPWLDFNMVQVWGNEAEIYPRVAADYARVPVKPTGLGEGSYEDGPQYPIRPVDARKVRAQAYWSYFAGGYHTYGNTNTWNFGTYRPERTEDWIRALASPGAGHLTVLKDVLTSVEWWTLAPDPSVFASGAGIGAERNVAVRSRTGARVLVYFPRASTAVLRMDRFPGPGPVQMTWIDPRNGRRFQSGRVTAGDRVSLSTPSQWPDALLLLEAAGTVRRVPQLRP